MYIHSLVIMEILNRATHLHENYSDALIPFSSITCGSFYWVCRLEIWTTERLYVITDPFKIWFHIFLYSATLMGIIWISFCLPYAELWQRQLQSLPWFCWLHFLRSWFCMCAGWNTDTISVHCWPVLWSRGFPVRAMSTWSLLPNQWNDHTHSMLGWLL